MTAPRNLTSTSSRTPVWHEIWAGVTHPAGVAFVILWLAAVATLVLRGYPDLFLEVARSVALLSIVPILVLLRLTPHPPEADAPRQRRAALWCQAAFVMAFILLTGLSVVSQRGLVPAERAQIPLWTQLDEAQQQVGERLVGYRHALRVAVLHLLLPGGADASQRAAGGAGADVGVRLLGQEILASRVAVRCSGKARPRDCTTSLTHRQWASGSWVFRPCSSVRFSRRRLRSSRRSSTRSSRRAATVSALAGCGPGGKELHRRGLHMGSGRGLGQFFARVNYDELVARVAKNVQHKRVLRLIRRYLEAGAMLGGVKVRTEEGTPQGGLLSALRANILLDDLDKELESRGQIR